jgi:hypothetical protein
MGYHVYEGFFLIFDHSNFRGAYFSHFFTCFEKFKDECVRYNPIDFIFNSHKQWK